MLFGRKSHFYISLDGLVVVSRILHATCDVLVLRQSARLVRLPLGWRVLWKGQPAGVCAAVWRKWLPEGPGPGVARALSSYFWVIPESYTTWDNTLTLEGVSGGGDVTPCEEDRPPSNRQIGGSERELLPPASSPQERSADVATSELHTLHPSRLPLEL